MMLLCDYFIQVFIIFILNVCQLLSVIKAELILICCILRKKFMELLGGEVVGLYVI